MARGPVERELDPSLWYVMCRALVYSPCSLKVGLVIPHLSSLGPSPQFLEDPAIRETAWDLGFPAPTFCEHLLQGRGALPSAVQVPNTDCWPWLALSFMVSLFSLGARLAKVLLLQCSLTLLDLRWILCGQIIVCCLGSQRSWLWKPGCPAARQT